MGSGVKEDFLEEVMWWRALKAEQNFISRRDVTCSLRTGHSRVFIEEQLGKKDGKDRLQGRLRQSDGEAGKVG